MKPADSTAAYMAQNRGSPWAPMPALGHIPFVGHRTVKAIWDKQARFEARNRLERNGYRLTKAKEYGFDPNAF